VIPDRSPQILEFASGDRPTTPELDVRSAPAGINIEEGIVAEEFEEPFKAARRLLRPSMVARYVVRIDGDDVRNFDDSRIALSDAGGLMIGD
jgi:hypothetical protein